MVWTRGRHVPGALPIAIPPGINGTRLSACNPIAFSDGQKCMHARHAVCVNFTRCCHSRAGITAYLWNFNVFSHGLGGLRLLACSMHAVTGMSSGRTHFGLTLMVNHACNLRCTYCYTGAKFHAPMPTTIGLAAINRALASIGTGGQLHLSFFGGEPLLEASRILEWMEHARRLAQTGGKAVRFNITTNGTVSHGEAWSVMMDEDLEVAISCDGLPEAHDRHRQDSQGRGSARAVEKTLRQLIDSGKPIRTNTVVRPDTLDYLPEGLVYLHDLGVRQVDLSLDLWTTWTAADGYRLEKVVTRAAELWRGWLPDFSLNWFDAKAGRLSNIPFLEGDTRCGFGDGEISVAPSGRLYPCERLIGEDRPENPSRLPGHVLDEDDFLGFAPRSFKACGACSACVLNSVCDTGCRCSNFVRSGDMNRPDGLLCLFNKATANAVSESLSCKRSPNSNFNRQPIKACYE